MQMFVNKWDFRLKNMQCGVMTIRESEAAYICAG